MLVFVGTYTEPILFGTGKTLEGKGDGIHVFHFDEATGRLDPVAIAAGIVNPSYLAFHPSTRFLYAVNEQKTFEGRPGGSVSAFVLDRAGGLTLLNRQPTYGTDPCHLVVDAAGRHVFVANFASGSVCVLPVRDDGSLGEATDFVAHVGYGIDPVRQKGPHAHAITLSGSNRYVFVPDLGLDRLMVYRFDMKRGVIDPHSIPWLKMKPGAGPRHLAFHPCGRFAYLVNELDSTVAALAYDEGEGRFECIQVVPTLPDGVTGPSTCADIQVAPSGQYVYASNRGHDSIAIFQVDGISGKLLPTGHTSTEGQTPRSFAIDPSGRFLLAANQDTDTIVAFRIDADNGTLRATGNVTKAPTPVCVKFF